MISMFSRLSIDSPDSTSPEQLQVELQKPLFGSQASEAQLLTVA